MNYLWQPEKYFLSFLAFRSDDFPDSGNSQELTNSAGEDAILAMNTFIKRLLAVSDPSQMKVYLYLQILSIFSPFD